MAAVVLELVTIIVEADSDSAAASPMPLAWTWVQAESLDMGLCGARGEWEGKGDVSRRQRLENRS